MNNLRDVVHQRVYMLTDWEKDIWTRVYIKVDRHAVVRYTFDRQQAAEQKFTQSLGMVDKTLFR